MVAPGFLSALAARLIRISVSRSLADRPRLDWKCRMNVARDMLHSSASSARFQGRAGSANMAEIAGASRGWPASASKPAGDCCDSLAARSTSVNSAKLNALSMAYPPGLSVAHSMRMSPISLARSLVADRTLSAPPPSVARTTNVAGR
ncbi:hypothetical protein D3C81_1363000 [compost metagenome]